MSEQFVSAGPRLQAALGDSLPLRNSDVVVVCAPVSWATELPVAWLDVAERRRLNGYRFTADRQRHHAAHALKRLVVGASLRQSPQDLAFITEANGKPRLVDHALHFNLSHSGQWVAVALRRDVEVGIDVECGRPTQPDLPWPAIAHPDDQPIADNDSFLTVWTVKEAVTKCSGEGLSFDFTRLRLCRGQEQTYRCSDDRRQWHAWHGMLDTHTHFALATTTAWSRLRLVQVSAPFVT